MQLKQFPIISLILICISILVAVISGIGNNHDAISFLFISDLNTNESYWPVNEPWRFVTPIFIHFGLQHIVFNSVAIWELGKIYEPKKGVFSFIVFILLVSIISNTLQYLIDGRPNFGGLSGLVYGIFGYLWIKGLRDDEYKLSNEYISISILWFVLCWTGLLGPIANWAHAGGLIVGCLWGFIESQLFTKKNLSSLAKLPAKKENTHNNIKSSNVKLIVISCIIFYVMTILVIFKNDLNIPYLPLNFNYISSNTPEEIISEISGVWKADSDQTLWEIDLHNNNIKILSKNDSLNIQIPLLIKDIDTENKKVVIEWSDIATNKKIVGTFTEIIANSQNQFTLKLSLDSGDEENFSEFIRPLGDSKSESSNLKNKEISSNKSNIISHFANNIKNQFNKNQLRKFNNIDNNTYSLSSFTLEDKLIVEEKLGEKLEKGGLDKSISKADFNDDGIEDFLIVENNSEWCGSGGCSTYLITLGSQPKLYNTNFTKLGGSVKFKLGKKNSAGIKNLIMVRDDKVIYGDKQGTPLFNKPLEYEFYLNERKLH
jgi:GlpG protein